MGYGKPITLALAFALWVAPDPVLKAANSGRQAEISSELEHIFQIFRLKSERRSIWDGIQLRKHPTRAKMFTAKLSYWRTLSSRDAESEFCQAYQWLYFGRGVYGKGVGEAFAKYPQLAEFSLELFDVDKTLKVGPKPGHIEKEQMPVPYLRLMLSRSTYAKTKRRESRLKNHIAANQCGRELLPFVDDLWLDADYIKQK